MRNFIFFMAIFCVSFSASCEDSDGDGIPNLVDNCPEVANPNQEDSDKDRIGDLCDVCTDSDEDGYGDPDFEMNACDEDNCPEDYNPEQADNDMDCLGNVCDPCPLDVDNDVDEDGLCADVDNCPLMANEDQSDVDGDSVGDVCDNCPNDGGNDVDSDEVCGNIDNCPDVSNHNQSDVDEDLIGDLCDFCTDTDGDGFGNPGFERNECELDNCPNDFNPDQIDSDGDDVGDICEVNEWNRIFGGERDDEGMSIVQTMDGNYVVVGYTRSFGSGLADIWLIKIGSNGDLIWSRTFGSDSSDVGWSVVETNDGDLVIAGHLSSSGILIKTDSRGNEYWRRVLNLCNEVMELKQTSDGGYVVTGRTFINNEDICLTKVDSEGNEVWSKTFDGVGETDRGFSVAQTLDGGYIVTGSTWRRDYNYDLWLIKTDDRGNLMWERIFGGERNDLGYSVNNISDGGYIITGYTESYERRRRLWLIKTDVKGNQEWDKRFEDSEGWSVKETMDGGFIITGAKYIIGEYLDPAVLFLMKTNRDGEELWSRWGYGDDNPFGIYRGVGIDVIHARDGGYVVAGLVSLDEGANDLWLIKTDSLGNAPAEPSNY